MRKKKAVEFLVFVLAVLCIWNANGLGFMVLDIRQSGSAIILLVLIGLYVLCAHKIGRTALLVLAFAITFLMFGLLFAIPAGFDLDWGLVAGPGGFILIFLGTTLAMQMLSENAKSKLIDRVAQLAGIAAIATICSPWLIPYYQNPPEEALRYSGIYSNPNVASVIGNIGVVLFLSKYWLKRGVLDLAWAIACAVSVVLTFSKAGMLTLLLIGILGLAHGVKRQNWRILVGLIVCVPTFWIILAPRMSNLEDYQASRIVEFQQLLSGVIEEESTTNRSRIWSAAWGQIVENRLIVGSGLGSMRAVEGGVHSQNGWLGAHTFWLVVLGEAGIFPFLFLVYLGIRIMYKSTRNRKWSFLTQGYLLVLFIDTLSSHNVMDIRFHAFLLGVCICLMDSAVYSDTPPRYAIIQRS